jgi:hypothetical protein
MQDEDICRVKRRQTFAFEPIKIPRFWDDVFLKREVRQSSHICNKARVWVMVISTAMKMAD